MTCIAMCRLFTGFGTAVALPGVVVHCVERHATGLYGPRPWGTRCAFGRQVWQASIISFRPGLSRVRCGPMPLNHVIRVSTDVLLFSEVNIWLVHHYRVFRRGLPHYTFRKDYLTRLRVFCRHRPWLSVPCLLRFRPAWALRGTFAAVMRRPVLLERHDVSTTGCARLEFGTFLFVPCHR